MRPEVGDPRDEWGENAKLKKLLLIAVGGVVPCVTSRGMVEQTWWLNVGRRFFHMTSSPLIS